MKLTTDEKKLLVSVLYRAYMENKDTNVDEELFQLWKKAHMEYCVDLVKEGRNVHA